MYRLLGTTMVKIWGERENQLFKPPLKLWGLIVFSPNGPKNKHMAKEDELS